MNGKSDRLGAPRQKQSTAATQIKGKTSKKASTLPSSDNESDNEPNAAALVRPKPPPSREFKVVARPTGQKKVEKKKEVILVSSDSLSGSEDLDKDMEEAATHDTDYEDDVLSKKRKAKSEGTSRASKKRVSPSVAKKGKVPMRPKAKEAAEPSGDERQDVAVRGMSLLSFSSHLLQVS